MGQFHGRRKWMILLKHQQILHLQNSEKIIRDSYNRLFGHEPHIRAIHAGLECGLIYQKFKGIDMISFGPTIRGAHTPEEKIEVKTVQMFWNLLTDVIISIPLQITAI